MIDKSDPIKFLPIKNNKKNKTVIDIVFINLGLRVYKAPEVF